MSEPVDSVLGRVTAILDKTGKQKGVLAAEIGMDPSKLSKSLSGLRRFTSFELASIAEIGGTSVDWILSGDERASLALAARAQTDAATPEQSAISQALMFEDIFMTLNTLGCSREPVNLTPPALTGLQVQQGQQLAQCARAFLQSNTEHSDGQLDDLPEVIENVFGIDVAIRDLGQGIDGLSWSRGNFKLALISNGVAWTRQRFTLAHELGHILAGDSQDILVDLDVMSPTMRTKDTEVRANAFAADFLMPAEEITAISGEITDMQFFQMLRRYGVSPSALAWRLFSLKRVDQQRRADLHNVSTRSAALQGGWRDEFQSRTSRQSGTRIPHLLAQQAFNAYSAGLIGARPLAAVLGVPVDSILSPPVVAPTPGLSPVEEPVFSP